MNAEQFSDFRHVAIHELMLLNENCEREFHISSCPRWEYDLEGGTLTFSQEGVPKVICSIQAVGTTSKTGGTWLWGWANESLPETVTQSMEAVRAFGEMENLPELTKPSCQDDEYLGWEMTAIAAKVLGAKGGYRCPGETGFLYVVYSSMRFATDKREVRSTQQRVGCTTHGSGFQTYACEHLVSNPAQKWVSANPDEKNRWPDAWCAACDVFFQQEGEWNSKNESNVKIKLLCHHCYERLRAQDSSAARDI